MNRAGELVNNLQGMPHISHLSHLLYFLSLKFQNCHTHFPTSQTIFLICQKIVLKKGSLSMTGISENTLKRIKIL